MAEAVARNQGYLPVSEDMLGPDILRRLALARAESERGYLPQGEMRSTTTPLGDYVTQVSGNPLFGRVASGVESGARFAGDVAYGLTGIPMMQDAASNLSAAVDAGDPVRGAGAVGEGMLSMLPYGGHAARLAFSTAPRAIATMTGYGAAPLVAGGILASDKASAADKRKADKPVAPEENVDDGLNTSQRTRTKELRKKIESGGWGSGAERRSIEGELKGLMELGNENLRRKNEATTEAEKIKLSAEAGARAQKDKLDAERVERDRVANTSIKELYPEAFAFAPVITAILAGGVGALTKGRYTKAINQEMTELAQRWQASVIAGQKALKKGDKAAAKRSAQEAAGFGDQFGSLQKKASGEDKFLGGTGLRTYGSGPAMASGAAVGIEGTLLPQEIDYLRSLPGSELEQKTKATFSDPTFMAERIGLGTIMGATTAKAGSDLTSRKVAIPSYGAETEALGKAARARGTAQTQTKPIGKKKAEAGAFDQSVVKDLDSLDRGTASTLLFTDEARKTYVRSVVAKMTQKAPDEISEAEMQSGLKALNAWMAQKPRSRGKK